MSKLALLVFAASGFAQTGATFEVATVKLSPPDDGRGKAVACKGGPGTPDPGIWRCTNYSLTNIVESAYELDYYQVIAPDWMWQVQYEINARIPQDATGRQFHEMIQNLLKERFQLEFHRDKKEMPTYTLTLAKGGPKFREAKNRPEEQGDPPEFGFGTDGKLKTDRDGYPAIPKGCTHCMAIQDDKGSYMSAKVKMADFAKFVGGQLHGPGVDETGLTGEYEIGFTWSSPSRDGSDLGVPIQAAVQQQLGLKVESKKNPVDVLVIDRAERNPKEN